MDSAMVHPIFLSGLQHLFALLLHRRVWTLPCSGWNHVLGHKNCGYSDRSHDGDHWRPNRDALGKFRPYLLWMAIPYGLCGYLMFANPDLSDSGKLIYAYVTYTLMMLAYTAIISL